jgi:hypothetical protein
MKKYIVLLSILSASICGLKAQVNFGLKVGANANKISGTGFSNGFNFNYLAGAALSIKMGDKIALVPELLFTQSTTTTANNFSQIYSGSGASSQSNLRTNKLNTLAIPVVVRKGTGTIKWELGFQYSKLINNAQNLIQNSQNVFKSGDFSAIGGLYVKLPFKLYINGRYLIGLNNINDVSNSNNWRSQGMQLSIGKNF